MMFLRACRGGKRRERRSEAARRSGRMPDQRRKYIIYFESGREPSCGLLKLATLITLLLPLVRRRYTANVR